MSWWNPETVLASLRVLTLGMGGVLATSVLFILLTVLLRWAFPPPRQEEGGSRRSNEL